MAQYRIEISGPKNEQLIFAPIGQKLRGRWDFSRTQRDKSDPMKALALATPVIPGIVVVLDTDAKEGRIVDPLLESRDGNVVFAKIQEVAKRFQGTFDDWQPWPTATHQLDVDKVKTWAHFMRVAVDCGYATDLSSVKLPTTEEIAKWPGKRARDPLNSGSQEEKLSRFVDEVPVDEKPALMAAGSSGASGGKGGK